MNWLTAALLAEIILGTSAIFDKPILKRHLPDPLVYTFWIGVLGLGTLLFAPFGFTLLSPRILAAAFASGALFIIAIFFLYSALLHGEASRTLLVIGGLSPIATLVFASLFLNAPLELGERISFGLLLLGAFILAISEERHERLRIGAFAVGSAVFMGASEVLSKYVFQESSFVSGFIWIKIGSAALALALMLVPRTSQRIRSATGASSGAQQFWYIANRVYAGLGSILFAYAISLGHPALVDATQSFKYIVIVIAGWFMLHEHARGKALAGKIAAACLVILGISILGSVEYARGIPVDINRHIEYGLTFSTKFADQLGSNWQETFQAMMSDLHPKKLRLVAYWDEIEHAQDLFDFSKLDWQLNEASRQGSSVILALGMKTPRWPECHIPEWAQTLSSEGRERNLQEYMKRVAARYQSRPEIMLWQIENEPYLAYGPCPPRPQGFLDAEIAEVKRADPTRPVLITDGGEFGTWTRAIRAGDVFGTTMYREVFPRFIGPIVGPIEYHLDPSFFRMRQKLARFLTRDYTKRFIVIELQAEPWGDALTQYLSYEKQIGLFSPEYFSDTIEYAKKAGFDEYYLWGVEWWYSLKTKYNDSRYWEEAKNIISPKSENP